MQESCYQIMNSPGQVEVLLDGQVTPDVLPAVKMNLICLDNYR